MLGPLSRSASLALCLSTAYKSPKQCTTQGSLFPSWHEPRSSILSLYLQIKASDLLSYLECKVHSWNLRTRTPASSSQLQPERQAANYTHHCPNSWEAWHYLCALPALQPSSMSLTKTVCEPN